MYKFDLIAAQAKREVEADQQAEEWGFACLEIAELVRVWGKAAVLRELAQYADVPPQQQSWGPQCSQCTHWQAPNPVRNSPGHCSLRASADLSQMPQEYASRCHFYEQDCPF